MIAASPCVRVRLEPCLTARRQRPRGLSPPPCAGLGCAPHGGTAVVVRRGRGSLAVQLAAKRRPQAALGRGGHARRFQGVLLWRWFQRCGRSCVSTRGGGDHHRSRILGIWTGLVASTSTPAITCPSWWRCSIDGWRSVGIRQSKRCTPRRRRPVGDGHQGAATACRRHVLILRSPVHAVDSAV